MIEFKLNKTGVLYDKYSTNNLHEDGDSLFLEVKDTVLRQAKKTHTNTGKISDWFFTNEPEAHLDEITFKILKTSKPKNILCFSYKDMTLAKRIKKQVPSAQISTLFDPDNGIIKEPPESQDTLQKITKAISNNSFNYDICLCRHYIEHFQNFEELLINIRKFIDPRGFIYLEVPDISHFLSKRIPLFCWEEHSIYFTQESFSYSMNKIFPCEIFVVTEGEDIEPSICGLFSIDKSEAKHSEFQENFEYDKLKYIKQITDEFKFIWEEYLSRIAKEIVLIGAGHNGDRFLQITNSQKYIHWIIDGNKEKQGKYLYKCRKPIQPMDLLKSLDSPTILLACHDRDVERLSNIIKDINNTCTIKSIWSLPK